MKAADVIRALQAQSDPADVDYVAKFYAGSLPDNRIMGARMSKVFPIAKQYRALPLAEVGKLLDDPHHEARMAAAAILDFKARSKRLTLADRQGMLALYRARHDRLDNWDHVDRAAPWVVGEAILHGAPDCLDAMAQSPNPNERRSAIVATAAWLRRKDAKRTYAIAEQLAGDADPYVHKALLSWLRAAGKVDPDGLAHFLTETGHLLSQKTAKALAKT